MKCPHCQFENPDQSAYCGKCGTKYDSAAKISLTKTIETSAQGLLRGAVFAGRYEILEELGRGGMGIVYQAKDSKLQRTVALKFLPFEWTSDSWAKERFVREAQAAASLDHPNICTVHEIDEAEGRMFISMAFVEGENLKTRIDQGLLKLDEALGTGLQVAEGLKEAHAKGIVHRDIKSANIMVTDKGQAKIMDFGLARVKGGALLTKEGVTIGTVAYMSPEQARGKDVDQRTDIWSFGVVLYEMFSGQLPFRGEHDQSVIHSILNSEPEPITRIRKDLPAGLENIIAKALSKKPMDRYQNMGELLEDLRAVAAGLKPLKAKPGLLRGRILGLRKIYAYTGLACLIVLMALALHFLFPKGGQGFDSIAVLPMENLSGDPSQEYFADGMTEELITDLGQLGGLKNVIARKSVMRFKGTNTPLRAIAQELKVTALITGAVIRAGDRVRITAQMINPRTEAQVWAHRYESDLRDVQSLENEIVAAIAKEVKLQLTPEESERLKMTRRVNPEAYQAYLKGQFDWYKLTRLDLDSALNYFELALEKDPNYARAYAGIAAVWVGRLQQGFAPASEAVPEAKAAAAKALELDNSVAEGHSTLANIKTWMDWDWEGGETEFRRAIELNPGYPDPRTGYSHLLSIMKRPEEAMAQIQRALGLDPLNPLFQGLYAMDLMYARRYTDAITLLRNTLKTSPHDLVALSTLRSAYHMKQMYPEALEIWKRSYAERNDHEAEEALARGFAEAGYPGALRRVAETLAARSRQTYVAPYQIGTLYTRAGMNKEALEWLEKAYLAHDPNMPYLSVDPIFDTLRADPRFQDILRRMNLLK
jgi:TolB-like protein/Tfp pilus assembly protein PilF/predicted Ser/Thr protein kinase